MIDEPSNLEKAKNFSKTAYDIVKGFVFDGNLLVPDEVKKARIDICRECNSCLLYTSPSPRDNRVSRMPSSA